MASGGKNPPANAGDMGFDSLVWEKPVAAEGQNQTPGPQLLSLDAPEPTRRNKKGAAAVEKPTHGEEDCPHSL